MVFAFPLKEVGMCFVELTYKATAGNGHPQRLVFSISSLACLDTPMQTGAKPLKKSMFDKFILIF